MTDHIDTPPKHWSRFFAVICLSLVLFVGAVVGAYALVIHETDLQTQSRAAAATARNKAEALQAEKTQILSSVPLCNGLILMDDAKNGASNASKRQDSYGHKLAKAITVVVKDSKCRILVSDVNHHVPFPQIARDLGTKHIG